MKTKGNNYCRRQWPRNRLDQLSSCGICLDDQDQIIYIADYNNHRVVEWKLNATDDRIASSGGGRGDRLDELNEPKDVVIDRRNNSLIIADTGNRRVMRWSRENNQYREVIISDIDCSCLTMHEDGSLYVSDSVKHEVRRWREGETEGTVVAGGNGQGNQPNQLNRPTYMFVDNDHTLYVADTDNDRMKWTKGAKEGIIVAGGNAKTQLSTPHGVVVDEADQIYVADWGNDRVMRWCEGAKEGSIVVGGNSRKIRQEDRLSDPSGLSLDGKGNLYVADCFNDRIQRFEIK